MKLEIIPVRKPEDLGFVVPCNEDEATGWGVYSNDDLEAALETREEAEQWLAKALGWTHDTPMDHIKEKAMQLVERLARCTTPNEEFEQKKNEDGIVETEGVEYEDADEMVSDMSDDRLCDEYHAFMEFVREAKEIVKEKENA